MPVRRACDSCKRRKVKCDAVDPCSNCRMSALSCQYNVVPLKRGRRVTKRPADGDPSPTFSTGMDQSPVSDRDVPSPRPATAQVVDEPRDARRSPPSSAGRSAVTIGRSYDAGQIHAELTSLVNAVVAPGSIVEVVHNCIDLFMQYVFPNTPIAHEPTLRTAAALFLPGGDVALAAASPLLDRYAQPSQLKSFTLITALCAMVTAVMPESSLPWRGLLAAPFLRASITMLRSYEQYDLEHPDSSSLAIRMWHSSASQNATGRPGAAFHYHGEATLLAQRLQLYDEESIAREWVIESQLLRACFWLTYIADSSAITFANRPSLLHELLFRSELTLRAHGDDEEPLLDMANKMNQEPLESRLAVGFHLKRRVWAAAAALSLKIRERARGKASATPVPSDEDAAQSARLTGAYLDFVAVLDNLPPWLRHPDNHGDLTLDDEVSAYQRSCFWAQRCNITTAFHCIKLIILQECIDHNMPSLMGLNGSRLSWAVRKLEITKDFLQELQMAPFLCYKSQGEHAVSSQTLSCTDENLITCGRR